MHLNCPLCGAYMYHKDTVKACKLCGTLHGHEILKCSNRECRVNICYDGKTQTMRWEE